ncbi:MAG: hypothetical protein Q9198_004851 [Flavoplaca austrocitrina]
MSSSKSTKSPPKSKGRLQAAKEQHSLSETVSEPTLETELRLFTVRIKSPITPEEIAIYEAAAHLILQSFHWDQLFEKYGSDKGSRFKRDVLIPLESEREHQRVLDELYAELNDLEKMYDELEGLKDWKQSSKYKNLEARIGKENKDFAQRKAERVAKERKA